jgi:hypothetical protein
VRPAGTWLLAAATVPVVAVLVVAVLLGALVGCSATPASPARLSPPITLDQLDVTAAAPVPCGLLRPDRATRRHLASPGAPGSGPGGPVCRWSPTAERVPAFTAGIELGEGLEGLYRRRAQLPSFEPADVAHYPAVDTRDGAGLCTTRVGVADGAMLAVTADDDGLAVRSPLDPCSDAETLATEIMGQLLAGSP